MIVQLVAIDLLDLSCMQLKSIQTVTYTVQCSGAHINHISWHELFLAGNQGNHQNLVPSMLLH